MTLNNPKKDQLYTLSDGRKLMYVGTKTITEDGKKINRARVKIDNGDEQLMSVYAVKLLITSGPENNQNSPASQVSTPENNAEENELAMHSNSNPEGNPEPKPAPKKRDSFVKELTDGLLYWFGKKS